MISRSATPVATSLPLYGTRGIPEVTFIDHAARRRAMVQVFWAVLITKAIFVFAMAIAWPGWVHQLSRDSLTYHRRGEEIAAQLDAGASLTSLVWLDDAWFSITGTLYALVTPAPAVVQVFNGLLSALGAVVLLGIGTHLYSLHVARTGAIVAFFLPSMFYWTVMPLKEAWAVLAITLVVYGTLGLKSGRHGRAWAVLGLGVLMIGMIRIYLAPILGGLALLMLLPEPHPEAPMRIRTMLVKLGIFGGLGVAAYLVLDALQIDVLEGSRLEWYLDVDNLNYTRDAMSRGRGRMFEYRDAALGKDPINDAFMLVMGVVFFFLSINPMEIRSGRQLVALPEFLIFLVALPALFKGVYLTWKTKGAKGGALLILATSVMAVYTTMATNMGAMYRWRIQALPLFILIAVYGAYERRRGVLYGLLRALFGEDRTRLDRPRTLVPWHDRRAASVDVREAEQD